MCFYAVYDVICAVSSLCRSWLGCACAAMLDNWRYISPELRMHDRRCVDTSHSIYVCIWAFNIHISYLHRRFRKGGSTYVEASGCMSLAERTMVSCSLLIHKATTVRDPTASRP